MLPALAIAEALVDAGHDPSEIHYVGAQRGIETRLLPATPFAAHVPRRRRPAARAQPPQRPAQRHDAAEAGRGDAAGAAPCCGGCDRGSSSRSAATPACRPCSPPAGCDVPIVVVSYDRRPGRASTLTARLAAASAVAFPDSPLPRAVVTGAPVRRRILAVDRAGDRADARRALDLPARPLRRRRHRRFAGLRRPQRRRRRVRRRATPTTPGWPCARSSATASCAAAPPPRDGSDGVLHQVVGYDDRIELIYAAADLLVGRGGASTVAEVAVTGTPAVLVPWSGAAEDHQTLNVRWLSDQGGGGPARRGRARRARRR